MRTGLGSDVIPSFDRLRSPEPCNHRGRPASQSPTVCNAVGVGVTVAVVGVRFGADFVPIYLSHPDVDDVVIVDADPERRRAVARRYGLGDGHASLDEALADPRIDAVHLLTPVSFHADMTVQVLDSGRHVACAVPMATSLPDIDRILEARARGGGRYMMMETAVYAREYAYVESMLRDDAFGALTLYRGHHIQNIDGYPPYWQGYPPMHYITHALAPLLALLDTRVETVRALGAGRLAPHRAGGYGNPFPSEIGLFTVAGSEVVAEVTVAFFQTARKYIEGFHLYGERGGVEWPADNVGPLTVYRMSDPPDGVVGNPIERATIDPPDVPERLPAALRGFVRESDVLLAGMSEPVRVNAHHGGSHPFLVHEFVSSILEGREPWVDAARAATWTAPGIQAHASALAGGAVLEVPRYR